MCLHVLEYVCACECVCILSKIHIQYAYLALASACARLCAFSNVRQLKVFRKLTLPSSTELRTGEEAGSNEGATGEYPGPGTGLSR